MFNDKRYFEVNREERFFCFLFIHALLVSEKTRTAFFRLVESRNSVSLNPANFEIYAEVAALRDYWHNLGDPAIYSPETHQKRRKILDAILNVFDLPASTIDDNDLFWTSTRKLWSPSEWSVEKLKASGLEKLINVRWAFNAKPDIMIVSGSTVLIIEAKVESGEGRNDESGYQQYEIQKLISRLLGMLVPQFKDSTFLNTVLELKTVTGISWHEVITLVEQSEIDEFSKKCLSQLKRFYPDPSGFRDG